MSLIANLGFKVVKNAAINAAKNMAAGIKFVRHTEVAVGAFGDSRNANLLYIHCNGSPANNIPPRNVLKAGLEDKETKSQMNHHLNAGARKALLGNLDGARAEYEQAGMIGQAAVQAQFGSIPPPLKPATIARKGSSATLIDTGALRDSIHYELREK